jgi:hypothetical protein
MCNWLFALRNCVIALTNGLFSCSTCGSELGSLYLRTELQNTFPFSLRASSNCRLTFTHHSEDLTKHSAFSQRRLQQTFPTATPQAKYLLVIKHVTCGNTPSRFPYFLPSSGRKTVTGNYVNSISLVSYELMVEIAVNYSVFIISQIVCRSCT